MRGIVFLQIEHDAELVEIGANGSAQFGAVLANARGEHERVSAVQFKKVTAYPMPRARHEYVERHLRRGISGRRCLLNFADVIGNAAEPFQASLFRKLPLRFIERQTQSFYGVRDRFGIEIADAIVLRQT